MYLWKIYLMSKRRTVRCFVVTWKCAILTALLQVTCLSYWTAMSYVRIAADLVRSVASVRSTLVRRSSTGSSQYSQGQNRDTVTLTTIKETVTAQTPVGSSHYATINNLTKQSTLWPQDYELVSWGNTKHAFFVNHDLCGRFSNTLV